MATPYDDEAKRLGVPVIPPLDPDPPPMRPEGPNPTIAICGECGLHVHQVMMFSCANSRCPAGFGPRATY